MCSTFICDLVWSTHQISSPEVFLLRITNSVLNAYVEEVLRDSLRPVDNFDRTASTLKWARVKHSDDRFLDISGMYRELCGANSTSGVPATHCELKGRSETHRLRFTMGVCGGEITKGAGDEKRCSELFLIIPIEPLSKHTSINTFQFVFICLR